jgi:hypothetical protein
MDNAYTGEKFYNSSLYSKSSSVSSDVYKVLITEDGHITTALSIKGSDQSDYIFSTSHDGVEIKGSESFSDLSNLIYEKIKSSGVLPSEIAKRNVIAVYYELEKRRFEIYLGINEDRSFTVRGKKEEKRVSVDVGDKNMHVTFSKRDGRRFTYIDSTYVFYISEAIDVDGNRL